MTLNLEQKQAVVLQRSNKPIVQKRVNPTLPTSLPSHLYHHPNGLISQYTEVHKTKIPSVCAFSNAEL